MQNLIKTEINKEELSKVIKLWFEANQDEINNDRNFWSRNPVGKLIKSNLTRLEYWRNKKRGNPKKGWLGYLRQKDGENS